MAKQPKSAQPDQAYTWEFRARFRARAYGWRSSRLACQRLKEAVTEIKKVARHEPILGAEGAVLLIERISPAFEQVDSSSGALGTAVNNAIDALVHVIAEAPADLASRRRWLERLFDALQEDQIPYIERLGDRWGELCAGAVLAGEWADRLVPTMLHAWNDRQGYGYFSGTMAALSAMLRAGRHQQLLELVMGHQNDWWPIREYGVRALAALGRVDEAIALADEPSKVNDAPHARARAAEEVLLAAGRREEAYRYALLANVTTNRLGTFRNIKKKYPEYQPAFILKDLIRRTPGEEGKWFATAKELGLFDLALELADESPVDHHTLMRAVRDFERERPRFALACALSAIRWMAAGYGYELTRADMLDAYRKAMAIAEPLGESGRVSAWLHDAASLRTEPAGWLYGLVGPPAS
jgi:hypothetical protein